MLVLLSARILLVDSGISSSSREEAVGSVRPPEDAGIEESACPIYSTPPSLSLCIVCVSFFSLLCKETSDDHTLDPIQSVKKPEAKSQEHLNLNEEHEWNEKKHSY